MQPFIRHTGIAVPLGLAFDRPSFGAAALYRIQEPSNPSRRGDALFGLAPERRICVPVQI